MQTVTLDASAQYRQIVSNAANRAVAKTILPQAQLAL